MEPSKNIYPFFNFGVILYIPIFIEIFTVKNYILYYNIYLLEYKKFCMFMAN